MQTNLEKNIRKIEKLVKIQSKSEVVESVSKPHPFSVSRKNIDNFRNSRPSFIVEDFVSLLGVNKNAAAKILMARGVSKLFVQRKSILDLLRHLKTTSKGLQDVLNLTGKPSIASSSKDDIKALKEYYFTLGQIDATVKLRRKLIEISNIQGMVIPSNDKKFENLLRVKADTLIKEIK